MSVKRDLKHSQKRPIKKVNLERVLGLEEEVAGCLKYACVQHRRGRVRSTRNQDRGSHACPKFSSVSATICTISSHIQGTFENLMPSGTAESGFILELSSSAGILSDNSPTVGSNGRAAAADIAGLLGCAGPATRGAPVAALSKQGAAQTTRPGTRNPPASAPCERGRGRASQVDSSRALTGARKATCAQKGGDVNESDDKTSGERERERKRKRERLAYSSTAGGRGWHIQVQQGATQDS